MIEEPRIIDHSPLIEAARTDAGRAGARYVYMTVGELWRLIHHAPMMAETERNSLAASLKAR